MIKYSCNECKTEWDSELDSPSAQCPSCGKQASKKSVKLFWCKRCNTPTFDEQCPICGEKAKYFAADARPVFPEERLLIELCMGEPMKYARDNVWFTSASKYYVNGEKLDFEYRRYFDIDIEGLRRGLAEYGAQNGYESFNKYRELFVQANASRFNNIVSEAHSYIEEMAKGYDAGSMFISFSGGKDSTVTADLVVKALSNPHIIHLFGDTTLELPYTMEYVKRYKSSTKRPVLSARNDEQQFMNLCKIVGPPSQHLRWCCTVFKTGAIGRKIQSIFRTQNDIRTFYGIRRSESNSRSEYERDSQSPKISKQKVSSPIIDWLDYDIWLYILTTGIDFNEAYRLGYSRVGCWCCPNNNRWSQVLAAVYIPDEYKKFRAMLLAFAKDIGKSDPEEYVDNGGWKARNGGEGIELSKNAVVEFKQCATDEKSFDYELSRPISEELYELFKPFGILSHEMGNARLGEVYVLDRKDRMPIFKLQGRIGTRKLRITIIRTPICGRKRIAEIESKFKCQLTKYQICVGCHACQNVCKHDAIRLSKKGESDSEYSYKINEEKCVGCYKCVDHYGGGCYMKRALTPRGKGYNGKA